MAVAASPGPYSSGCHSTEGRHKLGVATTIQVGWLQHHPLRGARKRRLAAIINSNESSNMCKPQGLTTSNKKDEKQQRRLGAIFQHAEEKQGFGTPTLMKSVHELLEKRGSASLRVFWQEETITMLKVTNQDNFISLYDALFCFISGVRGILAMKHLNHRLQVMNQSVKKLYYGSGYSGWRRPSP